MNRLITYYINNLTYEQIIEFANKNNINLSYEELNFVYTFIKQNGSKAVENPNNFDISKYKNKFSEENFNKINILINKYKSFL